MFPAVLEEYVGGFGLVGVFSHVEPSSMRKIRTMAKNVIPTINIIIHHVARPLFCFFYAIRSYATACSD